MWYYGARRRVGELVRARGGSRCAARACSSRPVVGADGSERQVCTCRAQNRRERGLPLRHGQARNTPWYWEWHTCARPSPSSRRCRAALSEPVMTASNGPRSPATHATRTERSRRPASKAGQSVVVYYGTPALQPQRRLLMSVQKLACRGGGRRIACENERERSQMKRPPSPHLQPAPVQAVQLAGKP